MKTQDFIQNMTRNESNESNESGKKMKDTLCWKCMKACGDCSWSDHWEHQPVKGWKAIPTKINTDYRSDGSFIVIECPEFIQEKPKKQDDMQKWMEIALRKSM